MPIGAYAAVSGNSLALIAIVTSVDGSRAAKADARGRLADAERIGEDAAELLLSRGAADILADVERARVAVEGLQP
jgi:hydroxymethylbilane synthase